MENYAFDKPYRKSFDAILKKEDRLWYEVWHDRCIRSGESSEKFKKTLAEYEAKYGKLPRNRTPKEIGYSEGFLACLRWMIGWVDLLSAT